MGAGALWQSLKSRYGRGLRVAYYRDVVRPRILQTPPVCDTNSDVCEIHVLTSSADWLNLIWALKTFYHFASRNYRLCIHDDGSLDAHAREALTTHFPSARLIAREVADQDLLQVLASWPRCSYFRQTNHLAPKLFDFRHYLSCDRMLLLDSDILFFAPPQALLDRIEDPRYERNTVNGDLASAYTVSPDAIRGQFGFELIERFNSGLGLIQRESLDWGWIEDFLQIEGVLGHFWRAEQTLYALCSSRYSTELLPREYDVRTGRLEREAVVRHYVGRQRHLMYGEGMRRLVKNGFLQALNTQRSVSRPHVLA